MLMFVSFKGKKLIRKKNTQLAEKLGLCSSKWSKNSFGDNRTLGTSSSFVNNTSLSILGHRNDLDYVSVEYVIETIVFL